MKATVENKRLAKQVVAYLKSNPDKHVQKTWVETEDSNPPTEQNFCGTTMCVAGATVFLADGIRGLRGPNIELRAQELLGLDDDQTHRLFYNMSESGSLDMLKALIKGDRDAFENAEWSDN